MAVLGPPDSDADEQIPPSPRRTHPRTLGWPGTVALAMGGSNQSLFLLGALLLSQGTAAIPLLIVGLALSWAALPGWTELILMWPDRVGGIAAACAEAFRPYSPVLANLTGVCYWWGWVPTCGLTAILSADALHDWYLPHVPVHLLAACLVATFMLINLCGIRIATLLAIPIAAGSAILALLSSVVPVLSGHVSWHRALSFHLHTPFHGAFGALTSAMAGLYLVGFAAPAFEAAACHVGEMRDPERNVPRAMFGAATMATLYFVVIPVVWLGAVGPHPLEGELTKALGPMFAPLLGGAAQAAAIWFMVLNMFHGTLQPLAGASRTLSQLSEDGLLPASWMIRNKYDVPWVTTALTAAVAIVFLQSGDPTWVIAAANLAYLIGIAMPSVAVWLLRRNDPDRRRPYRAPRGAIGLGLLAASAWLTATLLGFEQFGLPTVIASLAMCYATVALYAWRRWMDRRQAGLPPRGLSLHFKLTAAMVAVIALDGAGYLIAINHVSSSDPELVTALKDIFVAVALLTINVGLVIPGIISHAVGGIASAARRLTAGTLAELTGAMQALGRGDLDEARMGAELVAVQVRSGGELGEMASAFNLMQQEIGRAAAALDVTRTELGATKEALARAAEAMQYQALHDPLTGLPNRALFVDRLTHALSSCGRRRSAVAVLFLDVDHFKLVNDSLGHSAGDALLREIASRLDSTMRAGDTVARFGGDEFLLICEDVSDPDEARQIAARTIDVMKRPFWLNGAEHVASTSIGISIASAPGRDPEDLIREADAAMYRAKEAGRDRFEVYDEVMRANAMHRLGIESELRTALRRRELRLEYQPLVSLSDRRLASVEALVRWDHPRLGLIGPDEFIPVAEQTGVIIELGAWVLRTAIEDAARWQSLLSTQPVGVAVNLSARQVTHPSLLADVAFALDCAGLDPALLHLEITESTLLDPTDVTIQRLADLKRLGISIVLDDFGTGYSSLAYVKRFPIDTLKIDRAFIAEIAGVGGDSSIVEAIIAMAHGLKVGVVAEGVETDEQAAVLTRLGCQLAQGHLFSEPVGAERIAEMLGALVR